jgi:prolipoprotein diacylglyceryl transferase
MRPLPTSIPSPSDGTLEIGPLSIHAYGLMIALGVVAAVWLTGRRLEAKGGGTRDDASYMAVRAVIAGVIGARLYHVITDWSSFQDDLLKIVKIWKGGLGIPGGLIAGIAVGWWATKRRGVDPRIMAQAAAPAIPLAQAIGRWGNWFNQELFGKATTLPWGLEIDADKIPLGYAPDTLFHPTFLYESLWNFALAGLLIVLDKRFKIRPPRLMAMFVIGYGVGRFWVEGLRIDAADQVAGLRWNQWMAVIAVVGGLAYLLLTRGRADDPAPADDDVPAEDGEPDEPVEPDEPLDAADAAEDGELGSGADEDDDYVAADERVDES